MARVRKAAAAAAPRRRTPGIAARLERAIQEGHRSFDAKDPGMARLHFTHAIKYIRQSGQRRDLLPELIGMCGRCLQRQQRWGEALTFYADAAQEAKRQGLLAEQLRWGGKLATGHLDARDPATGIPLLEQSIAFGRRLHRKKTTGVIDELASQLTRLASETREDPHRSEGLWDEALALLEKAENPARRFTAAFNYASFLDEKDRPRQAATYLEEAMEIADRTAVDRSLLVDALTLWSQVCRRMKAFEHGGDLLTAQAPHFDGEDRIVVMKAAINAYFDGSLWEKMQSVAGDLWRIFEKNRDPGAADMGARYAIACREVGNLDEAVSVLEEALKLVVGDESMQEKVRAELARVLFEQGKHESAVALYEQLWKGGLHDRLNAMRYPLALIAVGRITDAKAVCAEHIKTDGGETDVVIPLARIAEAEGRSAIEEWQRAARESKGSDRALALERLLNRLPKGDPERLKAAEALARIAETIRENVADLFSENSWRAASPLAPQFNRYLDTFLHEAIAVDRHDEAVYELERFRSQLLVDVLSERANAWAGEKRTLGEKSGYADRAHRAEYRYRALSAMGAGWAERREAAKAADEASEQAFTAERVMQFGRQIFGMQFPDNLAEHLKDVTLARGETLVFLRITPEGTLLWYRGQDGRTAHESVPEFTLKTAQRIDTALRQERDITTTLGELDRTLANRLAVSLEKRRATRAFIVGGTDVANLPLDHCDSLVRTRVEIGFLPTARALGFARAARFPLPDRLYLPTARDRRRFAKELIAEHAARAVVVIDPTKSLRYADLEGVSVATALTKHLTVTTVEAAEASREKLQGRAGDNGYLHLISHGLFDNTNPYRTGMYLDARQSMSSLWTVADVFGEVNAPAGRLVVLSGCETGTLRGNVVSEEISLPAAFVASGFASVVASRWAVDDLSAALFVTEFYRSWLGGKSTVAAALGEAAQWLRALSKNDAGEYLAGVAASAREADGALARRTARLVRSAQADLVQRRPLPFSDPRHWAAFYVVGDAAQVRRTA
jgi:tetratricopeptide (TPR) repeat protein